MTGGVNKIGQRVDKFLVTGIISEQRGDGTYVLVDGRLIKEVLHYTVMCPECFEETYYDDHFEAICPECGLVCNDGDGDHILPEDETSMGRCTGGASGFPAINDAHQRSTSAADRKASYEAAMDGDDVLV